MDDGFQVVVVCRAPTVERMRREMFRSAPLADMLEVRLDSLEPGERKDLRRCFEASPRPTIATARRPEEGGHWREGEGEGERIAALEEAARAGADWIDLEWGSEALRLLERSHGAGRIVSHHRLDACPEDLPALGAALAGAGGNAVKLAVACPRPREVVELGQACADLASRGLRVTAIPLGPRASWGRLWAPAWGSWAGYFLPPARDQGAVPADRDSLGALGADEALDLYGLRGVGPDTHLYGVVGRGVARSLSPAIHMAALRKAGIDALYVPLEVDEDDLEEMVLHAGAFPFHGLSVTTPFKETAARLVTRLEGWAAEAGALNTVRREEDGSTSGFNTDGIALVELAERRIALEGARAVVLGAGGAARGVVRALVEFGARVLVLNRDAERARVLAGDLGCEWDLLPDAQAEAAGADLLVNATPLGGEAGPGGPGVSPVSGDVLRRGSGLVVDLVYQPRSTRLLREATRAGWEAIDGTEVLVAQAARQFLLWTGTAPDLQAMRTPL